MLRPALDPEVAAAVAGFPPFSPARLPIMRERSSAIEPSPLFESGAVTTVDYLVPANSVEVPLLIYRKANSQKERRPIIFWIHGGGMITGHRYQEQPELAALAEEFDAIITSVDYRLAPEYPYPVGFNDCYAALNWVAKNATELGGNPDQILVMGGSAGGNLAASCAIKARDENGPKLFAQMLFCPMLDDRFTAASQIQYAENTKSWGGDANTFAWECYLGSELKPGSENVPATAAPARLSNYQDLPQTFLDCGSAELFRDDVVAYASKLWAAGVPADLHIWSGGCHGFDRAAPHALVSKGAVAARMNWLRRVLGSRGFEIP